MLYINIYFALQAEEKLLAKNQDKEYGPIHGIAEFTAPAAKLAFGEDSDVIKNGLVCINFKTAIIIQCLTLTASQSKKALGHKGELLVHRISPLHPYFFLLFFITLNETESYKE